MECDCCIEDTQTEEAAIKDENTSKFHVDMNTYETIAWSNTHQEWADKAIPVLSIK